MSQSIAFIGVGNMGCPMAENLMKAGKSVKVFDVSKKMLGIAKDKNLDFYLLQSQAFFLKHQKLLQIYLPSLNFQPLDNPCCQRR